MKNVDFLSNATRKTAFALVVFLLQVGVVNAQDTIHSTVPPAGCFYNNWSNLANHRGVMNVFMGYDNGDRFTYGFITPDTLTVYGIAASLGTLKQLWGIDGRNSRDTTLENVYEYLCMYQRTGDTLFQKGEDLLVHAQSTPVSFYQDLELWDPYNNMYNPILPVYERFFETPQTVHDTFYVGRTNFTYAKIPSYYDVRGGDTVLISFAVPTLGHVALMQAPDKPDEHIHIFEYLIASHNYIRDSITNAIITDSAGNKCFRWGFGPNWSPYSFFIFPILDTLGEEPGQDTINNDGQDTIDNGGQDTIDDRSDTITGIRPSALIERYTSILPNPASNHVRVVSSFGLKHIKAYALTGEQIISQRCAGYSVDLDISRWSAGTYTLVITTHKGTVTKKLLVQ